MAVRGYLAYQYGQRPPRPYLSVCGEQKPILFLPSAVAPPITAAGNLQDPARVRTGRGSPFFMTVRNRSPYPQCW